MGLVFEWDPRKAASSLLKHGVSFREAATAFGDPFSLAIPDPVTYCEARWILLGASDIERLLVVVHTLRGENVRIISARLASPGELESYEEEGA